MLTLPPFDIINHLKSDMRNLLNIWTCKPSQIKKVVNYKVLDLFKLYSFDIKFILILSHMKKVMNFLDKIAYHWQFKPRPSNDCWFAASTGSSAKPISASQVANRQ
jgi:hypothetical protein